MYFKQFYIRSHVPSEIVIVVENKMKVRELHNKTLSRASIASTEKRRNISRKLGQTWFHSSSIFMPILMKYILKIIKVFVNYIFFL